MTNLKSTIALLACVLVIAVAKPTDDNIVYLHLDNSGKWPVPRMVKVNVKTSECFVEQNGLEIVKEMKALRTSTVNPVVMLQSNTDFDILVGTCVKNGYSSQGAANYLGLTWPGTKWCGPGNNAANFDDLGTEIETDKCCRAHDNCEFMPAFSSKNNLTNPSLFTRLPCDCDVEFKECLKNANSKVAIAVGQFFFDLVQNKCYKKDHPIIKCSLVPKRGNCNEYELNLAEPKLWQWFENPAFNS